MKLSTVLAALAVLSPAATQVEAANGTQLMVYTVYDSPTCSGKVVQNNYVVAPSGSCTKNTTCDSLSYSPTHGFKTGCSMSDPASTLAYSKETFGTGVDSVTWVLFTDAACTKYWLTSDSQMTTSLETARCNPQPDGTSKQFTFSADKTVTSTEYSDGKCTTSPVNKTIKAADMGKCVPSATVWLMGFATINGTTYGMENLAASSGAASNAPASLLATWIGAVSMVATMRHVWW